MVAAVGIGANARPGQPLSTFCYLRKHDPVAKVGDPAGFTSVGPVQPPSSWHCGMLEPWKSDSGQLCVMPDLVMSRLLLLRGHRGHQFIHPLVISGAGL